VHAGWRGTVAGVLPAAIETLAREYGTAPSDLRIAFGPSIGPCCFEVGPEVAAAFALWPGAVVEQSGRKPHVDLRLTLRQQALGAGVAVEAIDSGAACTMCDPEGRFYSYRRDASRTGQHAGFITRI
jgi:YfiH family protein